MSVGIGDLERLLRLEGTFNFRDLGGYRSRHGGHVRWRRLFRADGLHRLTSADLGVLRELGLSTVIDLRTATEVEERGRIAWSDDDLSYHHLPMIDVLPDRTEYPAWVEAEFVADRYRLMLAEGEDAVVEALAILTDSSAYPAVIHCAAGKDRTGILSAVILGVLGVAEEDIVADYALSAEAMMRMLEWLRHEHPDVVEELDRRSAAILAAEPRAMSIFLEQFRADYGSFEEFTASRGIASAVAHIQAALLER